MSKDIRNKNSKGDSHGYQELYLGYKLWYKSFFHNRVPIDYEEWYYYSGELEKSFYI